MRYTLWLKALDAAGRELWELALPPEDSSVFPFALFGRTADGGFYAGGSGPDPDGNYDYRILKIGPPPIPAAQDQACLLFLPELQGDIRQDGFLLALVGQTNTTHATEYSTNLVGWTPFSTNHVGTVDVKVRDLGATNALARFYRARKVEL